MVFRWLLRELIGCFGWLFWALLEHDKDGQTSDRSVITV